SDDENLHSHPFRSSIGAARIIWCLIAARGGLMRLTIRIASIAVAAFTCLGTGVATPVSGAAPLPALVTRDGRSALMVDGAPYLLLGAQVNNSSNWPASLEAVWPAVS